MWNSYSWGPSGDGPPNEGSLWRLVGAAAATAALAAAVAAAAASLTRTAQSPRPPQPSSTSSTGHAGGEQTPPRDLEPQHLLCPITQVLFRDPVFVIDSGNTYDRDALLRYWARVGEARDPLTNVSLASREVRTNWDARRQVQAFLDERPAYVPDGWDSRELLPPDRPAPRLPAAPDLQEDQVPHDGLPASVHAHCRAVAQAHGGQLTEALVEHFALVFQVDADALRRAFPGRPVVAGGGGAAEPEAAAQAAPVLPPAARAHCDALAHAHNGVVPPELLQQAAQAFGVDAAVLRAAYGGDARGEDNAAA